MILKFCLLIWVVMVLWFRLVLMKCILCCLNSWIIFFGVVFVLRLMFFGCNFKRMLCIVLLIIFILYLFCRNGVVIECNFGERMFLNLGEFSIFMVLLDIFFWIGWNKFCEVFKNCFEIVIFIRLFRWNISLELVINMKLF